MAVHQLFHHQHHRCLQTSSLRWPQLPLVHSEPRLRSSLSLGLHIRTVLHMESLRRHHIASRMPLRLVRNAKQLVIESVQVWNCRLLSVSCHITLHVFMLYGRLDFVDNLGRCYWLLHGVIITLYNVHCCTVCSGWCKSKISVTILFP